MMNKYISALVYRLVYLPITQMIRVQFPDVEFVRKLLPNREEKVIPIRNLPFPHPFIYSTSGLMVEYIVAIDVIRVRFAAGALLVFIFQNR